MAKKMVYFNATKKIETITIHYNDKLDGRFVDDVCNYIKEISKKMKKINLKETKSEEYDEVTVFVYPSVKLFNQVFNGVIEKRYYNRKRSLEDLYIVQDEEGNIHIASPSGKSQNKQEALKRILVMKILGEYMDEKDKKITENMLKLAMLKEQEKENEDEEKELEEQEGQLDEEQLEEQDEQEEELTKEELEELIEAENELDAIDEKAGNEDEDKSGENSQNAKEDVYGDNPKTPQNVIEARRWLSIGWKGFLNGKLLKEKNAKYFADHISKYGVKKLSKLNENSWYNKYEYSEEYAIALVEYIVERYDAKKFIEFYENPTDYVHVFGISKLRFEQDVKEHIKYIYSAKKMKENNNYEVTEVLVSDNGRAEMTATKKAESKKENKLVEESFFEMYLDSKM